MIRATIKEHHAEPTWIGASYKKVALSPGMYQIEEKLTSKKSKTFNYQKSNIGAKVKQHFE